MVKAISLLHKEGISFKFPAEGAFLIMLKFFLQRQCFAFRGTAVWQQYLPSSFLSSSHFPNLVETADKETGLTSLSGVYTDATDMTRTWRTSDVITMTFNAFSAAGYCRQLKADCRDLQKEADALRTELQSLSAEIK